MKFSEKVIAKNVIMKWLNYDQEANYTYTVESLDKFETLEDFYANILTEHNAPILFIPKKYMENIDFVIKVLKIKPTIINDIYMNDEKTYLQIVQTINANKFLKRCKFLLLPQVKGDLQSSRDKEISKIEDVIKR